MAERFQGKVALVTGAGGGIGRATSIAFAREGAKVGCADLDLAAAQATAAMIVEAGGEAMPIQVDVSCSASVQAMVAATTARWGRLDVAFNNAGVDLHGPLVTELDEEVWDRIIDVNLKGVFLSMKHEIPAMLESGGGAIVNTSSVAGVLGGAPGLSAYVASKHGVVGLTRNAALEFISKGIRINAVLPGAVHTPILDVWLANPGMADAIRQQHPIGRWAEPEEIARTVLFLASEDSSFVVGLPLIVDGGVTCV